MWQTSPRPNVKAFISASLVAVSALVVYNFTPRDKIEKPTPRIIDMMEEFQKSNIHIKDPERVKKLVTQLIEGGKDLLQVVSDFDKTMSRHTYNGERVPSCHGVLDMSEFLPESYRLEAEKLRSKYYPIEMDPSVEPPVKYKAMVTWWTTAHNLLVKCNLTRENIVQIVKNGRIRLRDGVDRALELLHANGVPLLVFSAGVGDILKEAIGQSARLYDNIHVIANFMDFDLEGKLVGFKGDLIHTFNKHEVAVHHPEIFEKNKARRNVILLGDTLGDLTMVNGMPYVENLLTIGFLNDHIPENLEVYKDKYDIVLEDEGTFDLLLSLLEKVFSRSR